MPEDMSDRMPEDMPDRMPEDMPDRMPDRMPNGAFQQLLRLQCRIHRATIFVGIRSACQLFNLFFIQLFHRRVNKSLLQHFGRLTINPLFYINFSANCRLVARWALVLRWWKRHRVQMQSATVPKDSCCWP